MRVIIFLMLLPGLIMGQGEQKNAEGQSTDQNGNSFEWINYGTQDWAIENAEVITYRDGTPIPQVTDATEWSNLTTGAWSYYDNDSTKGRLYNWYAVMGIHDTDPNTPNKEFAPVGWQVPTYDEWTTLENHLIANGYNYDGSITEFRAAKSIASETGWNTSSGDGAPGNNQSLNNSTGLTLTPTGSRASSFSHQSERAIYWTSDESSTDNSKGVQRGLNWQFSTIDNAHHFKYFGKSVRFIKD